MEPSRSSKSQVDKSKDAFGEVSAAVKCDTSEASKLCVYDAITKLFECSHYYDIGGTYAGEEPEFWFFFTTSVCHGQNYLLNLFVCHRKSGSFSIDISNSNALTEKEVPHDDVPLLVLTDNMTTYTFTSSKPNQNYFVKTFCLSKESFFNQSSTLVIPIKINVNQNLILNQNVLKSIKLRHDLSKLLSKQETTDFTLESASHKTYPTHRLLLAAHSPVLRNMLKKSDMTSMFIDISDNDMTLLLEYIYTGTIKDVIKQDCLNLLDIADKFQLSPLFTLTQHIIGEQINVENAIDMAGIAKKYKLEDLQKKVFSYIASHPKVMETDAWNNLTDVELAKYLFQYTSSMKVKKYSITSKSTRSTETSSASTVTGKNMYTLAFF